MTIEREPRNTGKIAPEATPYEQKNVMEFPDGFLWGVATSHFQVEGHPGEINNRLSDWAMWTTLDGKIFDRSTADRACEFFARYEEDIDLAKKLNMNSFRLSINWPAMCSGPDHQYSSSDENLAVYKQMLRMLKERGFKTFVTLFHFCLPTWLADIGGWNNELTIEEFERFSRFMAHELGEDVDFWLTINEPLAYVYQGYITGEWPPGYHMNYLKGFECVRNLLLAHQRAHKVIHEELPKAKVSVTHHWMKFTPRRKWNPLDRLVCYMRDSVFNHSFMRALHTGELSFPLISFFDHRVRKLKGAIPGLRDTLDFIGVNYYTRQFCEFEYKWPADFFGIKSNIVEHETSGLGWESHPEGLYDLLVNDLYPYRADNRGELREIYITENGLANIFDADLADGDWSLEDHSRVRYIKSHLLSLYRAITKGVNVKGYLHWSLLDNFEWAEGLRARFGLVRVTYPTLERTLRKSAKVYAEIAGRNAIPDGQIAEVPGLSVEATEP